MTTKFLWREFISRFRSKKLDNKETGLVLILSIILIK